MAAITQKEVTQTKRMVDRLKWEKEWNVGSKEREFKWARSDLGLNAGFGAFMGTLVGAFAAAILLKPLALGAAAFVGIMAGVGITASAGLAAKSIYKTFKCKNELRDATADLEAFKKNPEAAVSAEIERQHTAQVLQVARQQQAVANAARAVQEAQNVLANRQKYLAELTAQFAPAAKKPEPAKTQATKPANDAGKKAAPKKAAAAGEKPAPAKKK